MNILSKTPKIKFLLVLVVPFLMTHTVYAVMPDINIENRSHNAAGQVTLITGELGEVSDGKSIAALKNIIAAEATYAAKGNEDFDIKRQWVDSLGKKHTHLEQRINGVKVYGTSLTVHESTPDVDNKSATNRVYAVSGVLAVTDRANAPFSIESLRANDTLRDQALAMAADLGEVASEAELAYVYIPKTAITKLAWKIEVKYEVDGQFEHDIMFFDVSSAKVITRHPQVHSAKDRRTHTMNNQPYNSPTRPGTLLCTETQTNCGDNSAQRAHDGASTVYDYFNVKFGRDGINGAGMTMISSVHTGSNWNNAVWYMNQMLYGDGDGVTFGDLTLDFDIIGHEITHGVTQFTAGLIYQNESGAISEAISDILGISAEAYKNGASVPNWLLGGDAYTPGTAGDALRYMNDPVRATSNRDFYADRYTGTADNGGVHWNSGIANLAYVLLVEGGTHPRSKTTNVVPAIGLAKAEQIFYRGLTTYFNAGTDFHAARDLTMMAAQDLYGNTSSEVSAVQSAWCAVGVGLCPAVASAPTNPYIVPEYIGCRNNQPRYILDFGATSSTTILEYDIDYRSSTSGTWYSLYNGTSNYRIFNGSSYTTYYVRMRARNVNGWSTFRTITLRRVDCNSPIELF